MENFINVLLARGFQGKIGFIENGSWAITAARKMKEAFEGSQNIEFLEPVVSIKSAMTDVNLEEIKALKEAILK